MLSVTMLAQALTGSRHNNGSEQSAQSLAMLSPVPADDLLLENVRGLECDRAVRRDGGLDLGLGIAPDPLAPVAHCKDSKTGQPHALAGCQTVTDLRKDL